MELNKDINLHDFQQLLFQQQSIRIGEKLQQRIEESYVFLQEFSKNKIIYGVNTGFGPMAQYRIAEKDREQLQYNLIRSHASGAGKPLEPLTVKALMIARLNTLCLGKSGVHPQTIDLLVQLINKNISPLIFEHGGVGASGDLVQLAHLALVMIGEGEVFFRGKKSATAKVFQQENITPLQIRGREGLALINGTSVMTGIGILNSIYAQRLLDWSTFCSALLNELVAAYDDHFSVELNAAKLHPGQREIARKMRAHVKDSKRIRQREQHLYKPNSETVFKEKVQEYYSLRCVPQILGPVHDTLQQSQKILIDEVNSANDNPIIDAETKNVYHGGNFHGDYIALEMDKLKLAITKVSILAERQLNFVLNPNLNGILTPFVNPGKLGLNFGMQGAQFTAVSTTAENQALSSSFYIHSIPNNNDNQDVVSMGTNAANSTKKVIGNAFEVVSIELMTLVQAVRELKIETELSSVSQQELQRLKTMVPENKEDVPPYRILEKIKTYLQETALYEG